MPPSVLDSIPGPTPLLSRMLAWVSRPGSPSAAAAGPLNLRDPLEAQVASDAGAGPEAECPGFSSSLIISQLLEHAARTLGESTRVLLRQDEVPPTPHFSFLAQALEKALALRDRRSAELELPAGGPMPQWDGRDFRSLHPADYADMATFAITLFSRDRVGFRSLFQRAETGVSNRPGPKSSLNELFFTTNVKMGEMSMPQMLHVLNLAYVRTAKQFAGIAQSDVVFVQTHGEPALEAETEVIEITDGNVSVSSTPAPPGIGHSSLDLHFMGANGQVHHKMSLNGLNLFNMSRHITDELVIRWRDQLQTNIAAVGEELALEIATAVGNQDPQLCAAISENAHQLGQLIAQAVEGSSVKARLSTAGKAFLPLGLMNSAMKDFNSSLDRGAISLALRFGTMKSFTHATYTAFKDPVLQRAMAASPYRGAWALLALPPKLFGRTNAIPARTATGVQDVLRHMHDALEPAMRDRIGRESAQYLLGFRQRSGRNTTNSTGRPMAMSFANLPSLIEAGLIRARDAGEVLAGAMNLVAHAHGGADAIKRLPPASVLMTSRPLMELLANATENSAPFTTNPLNLDRATRIRAASFILRDAMEKPRAPEQKEDANPQVDEFKVKLDDFISAPSFEALRTYRGGASHAEVSSRALGSALRSLLGLQSSSKTPLATQSTSTSSSVRAKMEWDVALIRPAADFSGKSILEDMTFDGSGADVRVGSPYQITFVSKTLPQQWVSLIMVVASDNSPTPPRDAAGLTDLGGIEDGLLASHEDSGRNTQILILPMSASGPYGSEDAYRTFNPLVTRRAMRAGKGGESMTGALYRGLPGTGELLMPHDARKLGEASLAGMAEHASQLADLIKTRLVSAAARDPLLLSAALGSKTLDLAVLLPALKKPNAKVAADSAMRSALVATATGATDVIQEAAALSRDPFKTTRAGASILDLAEWAQSPSRRGLPESDRPVFSDHIEQCLVGLQRNALCKEDPERLGALLARSANNCLRKTPELISKMVDMGMKPNAEVTTLLEQMHPNQVDEDVRRQWKAAQMTLQILETQEKSRAPEAAEAAAVSSAPRPVSARRRVAL